MSDVTRLKFVQPALLVMTQGSDPETARQAARRIPAGQGLILRHYTCAGRERLARDIAAICRARGVRLLIGADPALARRVGAYGVHYPESALRRAGQPRWPRGWLITAAAHSLPAVLNAQRAGVHAILLSPILPTPSHPAHAGLGLMQLARICAMRLPVYALGGIIRPDSARRCLLAGAVGLAGVRVVESDLPERLRFHLAAAACR